MFLQDVSLPCPWFVDFLDKVACFPLTCHLLNHWPVVSEAEEIGRKGSWPTASPLGFWGVSPGQLLGPAFCGLPWLLGQVVDKLLPVCGL